jgi:hypothetical protein
MAVVMLSFCLIAIASYAGVIWPSKRFEPLHEYNVSSGGRP